MHVLILGPTGTAGSAALQQALKDDRIDRVTTLHRRRTGLICGKLQEIVHADFRDYSGLEELFKTVDVCLFCLGVSQFKEKDPVRFFQITHDYPVMLAKALLASNPSVAFCFLSGHGADPSGKSKIAFAKAKGAAEKSLAALGLRHLYIFRPAYIHPADPHPGRLIGERIFGFLYPALRKVLPSFVIHAHQLGVGMINAGLNGDKDQVFSNTMIKEILPV